MVAGGGGGGVLSLVDRGGVCRRPSLRQLELTACCWPCFWKGTMSVSHGYDRCKPVRTMFGVPVVIVCVFVFVSFRVGAARVGLELLGLTVLRYHAGCSHRPPPGPASHDPRCCIPVGKTQMLSVPGGAIRTMSSTEQAMEESLAHSVNLHSHM